MNELRLELEHRDLSPRDQLRGNVRWQLASTPTSVEIRLFWYTSGKGDRDTEVVDSKRYQQVGATERRDFEFRLPNEPYSFSGKLISLIWAVEVEVEPSGETAREEFVMGPEGREVRLSNASM